MCFPVLLPPMSLHCSSNQLAVAVLSWRGSTSMGAEGGINKLVRWGEKMCRFCLGTLEAAVAAEEEQRLRIKLNSILRQHHPLSL